MDVVNEFVKTPQQEREFRDKIDTYMGVAGRGSALKATSRRPLPPPPRPIMTTAC